MSLITESHVVGVVVELREPVTAWGERRPYPVALLIGRQDLTPWTPLADTPGGRRWFLDNATITFYADATGRYRTNLEGDAPQAWVSMRPTGMEPPFDLVAVTVDSDEGESFTETPNDVIETVAMPEEIAAALARFTTLHHRERIFIKRKRKDWTKDKGA
jgi:hypothetical protein